MPTKELQKWAGQLGWKEEKAFIWGSHNGFLFSIKQLDKGKQYETFLTGLSDEQADRLVYNLKPRKSEHHAKTVILNGKFLTLIMDDDIRASKREQMMLDLLSVVSAALQEAGVPVNTCSECHTGCSSTAFINNMPVCICDACYQKLEQQLYREEQEFEQADKYYGRGIIGAILGAMVGTIPWIIVAYFGYLAAILGFLIGQASLKGYKLLGGVVSKATKWIILASIIIGLVFAQFVELLLIMAQNDIPLTAPMFSALLLFPGMLGAIGKDMLMSLFMAGLGIWPLFSDIRKKEKPVPTIQRAL